ncbi:MAG: TatD family hydrolase [Chloroflexi bacterium]|nr:TatD family hydrolase [Chloroflexota bacterium]
MSVSALTIPRFIDCHAHLHDFSDAEVSEILARAEQVGVSAIITAGTTPESSKRAVYLAETFPKMFAGVGIHPMDLTGPVDEPTYTELKETALSSEKVVVMSEVGLDYMEGAPDRATQFQAFREQIRLARELALPVVFHSRESHTDTLRVLREEQAYEVGGAMHYFQGNESTARSVIDMGMYISLARPLLHLPELQRVAKDVPLEHIVLETDTFPQPFKKKRENWTEPRHLADIAVKLAELKGMEVDEVQRVTTANALRMLGGKATALLGILES